MKFEPALPVWSFWFGLRGPLSSILRPYRWSAPIIIAGGVVSSVLEGMGIGLLAPLLASLMPDGNLTAAPGAIAWVLAAADRFGEQNRITVLVAAIVSAIVVKAAVQATNATFLAWVDTKIGHDIRSALSERVLTIKYPFFLDHDPGRLVTIIATDSWRTTDAVRMSFSSLIAPTALAVFGVLMAWVSLPLLTGVVLGTGGIRLMQMALVRRVHALGERLTEMNRALANHMLFSISAIRLIRIFGQERHELRRFNAASDAVRQVLLATERQSAVIAPALEVAQMGLFIAVLLGAATAGIRLPVIVAFLLLLYRAEPHLRTITQSGLAFAALRSSIREVEWLLSIDTPAAVTPVARCPPPPGSICFDRVTFSYPNRPGKPPALDDVSFVLREGSSTALIGRSGSGKTTVINVLCQLISPTAGVIRIGGVDLSGIDLRLWRRQIGLAGQDLDLVAGSIADNISYGAGDASPADIEHAAELADAAAFIQTLPQGYDTAVGVNGMSLSGGQRQRIGIARAIVRKPRLLILDEATNSIDSLSESKITSLLKQHLKGVTTIVISHQAAVVATCDDAILLEAGRVVCTGPATSAWALQQSSADIASNHA